MSNNRKSSLGKSKNGKPVKVVAVTDTFKKMMEKALPAAQAVLKKRKEDLEKWGELEQNDFFKIFGVKGSDYIDHRFEVSTNLDTGGVTSTGGTESTTVIEFMRRSVDRMIVIADKLKVGDRIIRLPKKYEEDQSEAYKYGNFVNRTYRDDCSAFVIKTDTQYYKPSQYGDYLEINIGQHFITKHLTGTDSMASTLCHEISHFVRIDYDTNQNLKKEDEISTEKSEAEKKLDEHPYRGSWGGVGTEDLPNDADHKKKGDKTYSQYKDELKKSGSLKVFENAYNFELYFEVENNNSRENHD